MTSVGISELTIARSDPWNSDNNPLLTQLGLSADVSVAKIKQKAKHLKFISFLLFRFWYKIFSVKPFFYLLFISDLLCIWAPRFFDLKSSDINIHDTTSRNGVTIWYTSVYSNHIQYITYEYTVLAVSFVDPSPSVILRVTNCHAYL